MKIRDFGVEMWMAKYENDAVYNIAEIFSIKQGLCLCLGGHWIWRATCVSDMRTAQKFLKRVLNA